MDGTGKMMHWVAASLPFRKIIRAFVPLLLGLLTTMGMQDRIVPSLVLASFAGFTGVMISPIHVCFPLNCSYFGVDLAGRCCQRPSWQALP